MKKILLSLMTIGLLAVPILGLAWTTGATNVTKVNSAPNLDVMNALNNIINWLFTILLVVAAIFIIVAAYYFVTAAGAPEKVEMARNFVLYALIGVLVAFLARGLVLLIGKIVGAPGF